MLWFELERTFQLGAHPAGEAVGNGLENRDALTVSTEYQRERVVGIGVRGQDLHGLFATRHGREQQLHDFGIAGMGIERRHGRGPIRHARPERPERGALFDCHGEFARVKGAPGRLQRRGELAAAAIVTQPRGERRRRSGLACNQRLVRPGFAVGSMQPLPPCLQLDRPARSARLLCGPRLHFLHSHDVRLRQVRIQGWKPGD
jgi:hypothetical protein